MTKPEIASLEPSWQAALDIPSASIAGQAAVIQAPAIEVTATRLEGPSTLVLALIGAATLAAYRGIGKRLAARPTAADAVRSPLKPRRRAA